MSAILSLKGKKANALLVIRVGKDGTLRDSKPCQYCYEFIYKIGIKKIYFSTNNQEVEIMRINDINREDLTVSGSNVKLKQSNRSVLI
jgi:deoxycytidylate deaminase